MPRQSSAHNSIASSRLFSTSCSLTTSAAVSRSWIRRRSRPCGGCSITTPSPTLWPTWGGRKKSGACSRASRNTYTKRRLSPNRLIDDTHDHLGCPHDPAPRQDAAEYPRRHVLALQESVHGQDG